MNQPGYVIIKKSRHYRGGLGRSPEAYTGNGPSHVIYNTLDEARIALKVLNNIGSTVGYDIYVYVDPQDWIYGKDDQPFEG